MTTLLVITDGRRECITQTVPSALAHLVGRLEPRYIYDDSGDPAHRSWLVEEFGPLGFQIIWHPEGRQGFGGAIRAAWQQIEAPDGFVFHLEDDFTFNRPVDVDAMCGVLARNSLLVQVCLRRQPWNDDERAAGGIVEQHPGDYWDTFDALGNEWLEHTRCFSTNPCVYRANLRDHHWPEGLNSEGHYTHRLVAKGYRFAYWGARESGEWVTHIGAERVGVGY